MHGHGDITLPSSVCDQIREMAAHYAEDPNSLAVEIILSGISLAEKRRRFRAGEKLAEVEEARAILRRSGTEPPRPGDELPEDYVPLADTAR